MSATHFQATCQALLRLAVESLASAQYLTESQTKTRTEAVIQAIMAFLPTEPVQVMLASQAVGHHLSLLDTFQQIHSRSLADPVSLRMRTISATQTRMTLALVRELRAVRAEMAAAAQAEAEAEHPPPMAAAEEPAPAAPPPAVEAPLDDATFAAHVADFEHAATALRAALEEARARDTPAPVTAPARVAMRL